jgi:hypothetical protein
MLVFPPEILERLNIFCEANGFASMQIGNPAAGVHVFIFGRKDDDINFCMVTAAHAILEGVLSGASAAANEAVATPDKEIKPN